MLDRPAQAVGDEGPFGHHTGYYRLPEPYPVKPLPDRGELARRLMGAGRHLLKPGADPIGDLIREREQDDHRVC
jgi:hypothetical protein